MEGAGGDAQYTFAHFIAGHKSQLDAGGVPPHLWPQIYKKLLGEVFDAGDAFRIICEESEDGQRDWSVLALREVHPDEENDVFLIDHAWTFRPHQAREQLDQMPQLVERLKALFDIQENSDETDACSDDEVTTEQEEADKIAAKISEASNNGAAGVGAMPRHESVDARLCYTMKRNATTTDAIMKLIWKYAQTYTVRYKTEVDEEGMPLWYVMDEFGVRIGHSTTPNCRVVPLLFVPQNVAYNVLFMTSKIDEDEELLRNYADNLLASKRPDWIDYLTLPWISKDFSSGTTEREPLDENFFTSGRSMDSLPTVEEQKGAAASSLKSSGDVIKVFADDTQMVRKMKDLKFELVDDWHSADVVWMRGHFHEYRPLCIERPAALVNQFPFESSLTVKDLLSAILMQKNGGAGPKWFQTCYNLQTELPQFVAAYQQRQKKGVDNSWIVKPWNLARGLDMHVTDELGQIIRLIETGPKIACKYIDNPVLFTRPDNGNAVKFDLRFILFVESLRPVKAYVYNKFWIRFAINEFVLDNFDDNETHFTVFNYADKSKILQMECADFVTQLQKCNPNIDFNSVLAQIHEVFHQALEAVSEHAPPLGVGSNVQSRAMYGTDVMLQWTGDDRKDVQVTLLECNFMPDCERACNYYPDFADTVFKTMFLGEIDSSKVTAI